MDPRRDASGTTARGIPFLFVPLFSLESKNRCSPFLPVPAPKGGCGRTIPIHATLREVITPLASQFPSPPGERGFVDGRVHSFRHYFVSQAFLSGVGEGEIMTWVGHRDSKMVAHYRHLGNADARLKMNQIDFLGERSASDGPIAQAS